MDIPVRLSKGRHLLSRRRCLMEHASLLAGERRTDHPRCVHPALASASRVANDTLSPERRQELLKLLPLLMGTSSPSGRTGDVLAVRLAHAAASFAYPRSTSPFTAAAALSSSRHWLLTLGEWTPADEAALQDLGVAEARWEEVQALQDVLLPATSLHRYVRRGVPATLGLLASTLEEEDVLRYLEALAWETHLLSGTSPHQDTLRPAWA